MIHARPTSHPVTLSRLFPVTLLLAVGGPIKAGHLLLGSHELRTGRAAFSARVRRAALPTLCLWGAPVLLCLPYIWSSELLLSCA
eukprot:192899-Alexandrium_andersonii.AAC.1